MRNFSFSPLLFRFIHITLVIVSVSVLIYGIYLSRDLFLWRVRNLSVPMFFKLSEDKLVSFELFFDTGNLISSFLVDDFIADNLLFKSFLSSFTTTVSPFFTVVFVVVSTVFSSVTTVVFGSQLQSFSAMVVSNRSMYCIMFSIRFSKSAFFIFSTESCLIIISNIFK